MNREIERDTVCPEYNFSAGVRGKYHLDYSHGTNVVLLDPDVAAVFKDAAAVNAALCVPAQVAKTYAGGKC